MDAEAAARALVGVEPDGDELIGRAPEWSREIVFGGVLLGQVVSAASRVAPDERRIHSLHAYFLRPARADDVVRYRTSMVRQGASFTTCRVDARQNGKDVLTALCSFTTDGEAYEYEAPLARDVPAPGATEAMFDLWDVCNIGPAEPDRDGVRASTSRMWVRTDGPLPDDPHLHAALLAFVTDWTWTRASAAPRRRHARDDQPRPRNLVSSRSARG